MSIASVCLNLISYLQKSYNFRSCDYSIFDCKIYIGWAEVVARLVEWSLLTPKGPRFKAWNVTLLALILVNLNRDFLRKISFASIRIRTHDLVTYIILPEHFLQCFASQ